jgi:uncharacterized membrane protein YeaQ/YmgE (transglycosylase-associated protein family)
MTFGGNLNVARGFKGVQAMTLTLPALIVLVVIAFFCGAVGNALAGGTRGGLVTYIALGFIGALFGSWLAGRLNLSEPLMLHMNGQTFPIVWSVVGAALVVAMLHLMSGQRWARS